MLEDDRIKDMIIDSLRFLVNDGRVVVYDFVIMPNHIHVVWQVQKNHEKSKVQQSFLKYTAQKMKFYLIDTNDESLENYKVRTLDRECHFWERNSLSINLWSSPFFMQKLSYIHNNPVASKWKLCEVPEKYQFSSYRFYESGVDEFDFLFHYNR